MQKVREGICEGLYEGASLYLLTETGRSALGIYLNSLQKLLGVRFAEDSRTGDSVLDAVLNGGKLSRKSI